MTQFHSPLRRSINREVQISKLTRVHQTVNVIFAETFEDTAFYLSKVIGYQQSQQSIIVSNDTS